MILLLQIAKKNILIALIYNSRQLVYAIRVNNNIKTTSAIDAVGIGWRAVGKL